MEFPEDVLGLIRMFSKPRITRRDWRTCKQTESNLIRRHNDRYQNQCRYYFMETLAFSNEIVEWTLYGRTRALHHMNWFTGPVPPDADWYETRMRTYDWQTDEIETQTQTN